MEIFNEGIIVIASLIGVFCAFIYYIVDNAEKRIVQKIDSINDEMEKRLLVQDKRLEKQDMRLDGLYTILINKK